MKYRLLRVLLFPLSLACAAETTPQLQEQLKRYPDADTNRDGVLTMEEAQAYAKTVRKGKKGPTAVGANDDVDMLKLISRDDPPVFMFTAHPGGELTNRGHYLHHPNHARAVKKACDEAGVPATVWFAQAEPRISGDHQVRLREFLFKHLRVASDTSR
jgi:hypothetical protein